MADYYPLLARAVAGLKTSTPQARRAIYERARGALLAQLRAMNPPIPEPDIQRESDALDAAIARLEADHPAAPEDAAEALRKTEAAAQAVREAEAKAAQAAAERERAEAEARAQEEARAAEQARAAARAKAQEEARAEAARREQERLAAERAAREHAEQEARLAVEKREREARERAAAEQAEARRRDELAAQARAAEAVRAATAAPTAPVAPAPGEAKPDAPKAAPPKPEAPRADAPKADAPKSGATPKPEAGKSEASKGEPSKGEAGKPAPAVPTKPPASAPHRPEPPPPPPAPDIVVDEPIRDPAAAPPIAISADDPPAALNDDPFAAFAAEREPRAEIGADAPELAGDPRHKPSRPAAPLPPPERPSHLRHILAGAALALALGGIGYAAWMLRDKPQELPRPKTAAETAARPAEAGGKIAERIGVAPSAPVPTVQAPAQTIRPAEPAPSVPPPPPPIAAPTQLAPARAAFLIQSDGPEQHKVYSGVVNWRVENGAWRAEVTIPEVKLAVSAAMSKSGDGGPASHKIDLRFQFDDPAYQIGRIGVPEMRKEENPYGDRLAAVAVPVTQSVYLIGLRKDEADIAYNLELIRGRSWIDIPMEMADKKIAKVTFEKGPAGDATFAEALKGW
jgi:hypothetical protein